MDTLEFHSRVDDEGVLSLRVPLGATEANSDVIVTIQPAPAADSNGRKPDWHRFVAQTYGSCADLGLEEPPDLPLQSPDASV